MSAVSKAVPKGVAKSSEQQPKRKRLKIGELVVLANIAVATIRYYEMLKLLNPTSEVTAAIVITMARLGRS